jgi:predicted transcriptional regulator
MLNLRQLDPRAHPRSLSRGADRWACMMVTASPAAPKSRSRAPAIARAYVMSSFNAEREIEDASVMAEEFAQATIESGLANYENRRTARVKWVQHQSTAVAAILTMPSAVGNARAARKRRSTFARETPRVLEGRLGGWLGTGSGN